MRRGLALALLAAAFVAAAPAHATFPARNGDIAYTAITGFGDQRTINIFRVPSDSGNPTADSEQLTHFEGLFHRADDPQWSPDGARIAFDDVEFAVGFLGLVNADGSGRSRVENCSPAGCSAVRGSSPTWAPDGSTLAFVNRFGVSTVGIDGRDEQVIRLGGAEPDVSPDGATIVFECGFPHLCLVPRGGGPEQVIGTGFDPDWSPDGSKIAFTKSDQPYTRGDIWVMDRDGSNQVQLTNHPAHEEEPAWSPDGRQIAFVSNRHVFDPNDPLDRPFQGIWATNADGTNQRVLVHTGFSVDWQPVPNRPPDCSALAATPDLLWPPNRRLRPVTISGATDPDGDQISLAVLSVTQDEPVRGPGDSTRPDARPGGDADVLLRAERAPRGDGRVYGVEVAATDGFGGECRKVVKVTVPRHRSRPAVESPGAFDSFDR